TTARVVQSVRPARHHPRARLLWAVDFFRYNPRRPRSESRLSDSAPSRNRSNESAQVGEMAVKPGRRAFWHGL
ncbi:MAG TPA: hypothetical protein VJZ91_16870, partial [Blastocatellia bacterium]|nr:hypothetical protein [Blastocatellia bacterium]